MTMGGGMQPTTEPMRLRCACGWETTGSAEDELVAAATDHGRRVHNMVPTRDEVLAMIVPAANPVDHGRG
jgi:predicted small metal-binding protein